MVKYLVDKGADIDIQDNNGVIIHAYSLTNDSVALLFDFELATYD